MLNKYILIVVAASWVNLTTWISVSDAAPDPSGNDKVPPKGAGDAKTMEPEKVSESKDMPPESSAIGEAAKAMGSQAKKVATSTPTHQVQTSTISASFRESERSGVLSSTVSETSTVAATSTISRASTVAVLPTVGGSTRVQQQPVEWNATGCATSVPCKVKDESLEGAQRVTAVPGEGNTLLSKGSTVAASKRTPSVAKVKEGAVLSSALSMTSTLAGRGELKKIRSSTVTASVVQEKVGALSAPVSVGTSSSPEVGLIPTATTSAELVSLFAKLQQLKSFRASFKEVKKIQLLSKPLLSEGMLAYVGPDRLVRILHKPRRTKILVRPDKITTISDGGVEHMDLVTHPEIRGLVGSVLQLLQGDIETIGATYTLYFSSEQKAWELRMIPKSPRLLALVREIIFLGEDTYLEKIKIKEASDDVSETVFSDVQMDIEFSEAELQELFGED